MEIKRWIENLFSSPKWPNVVLCTDSDKNDMSLHPKMSPTWSGFAINSRQNINRICFYISKNCTVRCKTRLLATLKALANEDTLLRTHCCRHKGFPVCPRAQHLLRTRKKCFWFCSETFCVRIKCFPVCAAWNHNIHFVSRAFARPRKIMNNNVSATMCPRLPVP